MSVGGAISVGGASVVGAGSAEPSAAARISARLRHRTYASPATNTAPASARRCGQLIEVKAVTSSRPRAEPTVVATRGAARRGRVVVRRRVAAERRDVEPVPLADRLPLAAPDRVLPDRALPAFADVCRLADDVCRLADAVCEDDPLPVDGVPDEDGPLLVLIASRPSSAAGAGRRRPTSRGETESR